MSTKPAVRFKLVPKSLDDPNYDIGGVLVDAATVQRHPRRDHPASMSHEAEGNWRPPSAMGTHDAHRRKRRDLAADEAAFEEMIAEAEETIDDGFLRGIVQGGPDYDGDDHGSVSGSVAPSAAPSCCTARHSYARPEDKSFETLMREFARDEYLNDDGDDDRALGALPVTQYSSVLAEYVDANAGQTMVNATEPSKHRGLLHQLHGMSLATRVFDTDDDGVYTMTVLPDKASRLRRLYSEGAEELKRLTRERVVAKGEAMSDDDDESTYVPITLPPPKSHGYDCETVLTTHSTAFNHPNVLRVATDVTRRVAKVAPDPAVAAATAVDEANEDDDGMRLTREEIAEAFERPAADTRDERRARQALAKAWQRQRRAEKKSTKLAYRGAVAEERQHHAQAKTDRRSVRLDRTT